MSSPQYYRDKARENYEFKKELSARYRIESEEGETFSEFVKRIKEEIKESKKAKLD